MAGSREADFGLGCRDGRGIRRANFLLRLGSRALREARRTKAHTLRQSMWHGGARASHPTGVYAPSHPASRLFCKQRMTGCDSPRNPHAPADPRVYKGEQSLSQMCFGWGPCQHPYRCNHPQSEPDMTTEANPCTKRPLHSPIQAEDETYSYQSQLGTMGMRIRQSVDQGYKLPSSGAQRQQQCGDNYSNVCIQDNSTVTIPEYKRVPLPAQHTAPMLVNQRTVSSASSLEMWEDSLDQRLNMIDGDIMRNKMGAGDLDIMFNNKRNWEQAHF